VLKLIETFCSRFFKIPAISPAFSCCASCDPSTNGGLLLRHFAVAPPAAGSAEVESTVTFISTMLPLHDVNEVMKTETVFSLSTARQVRPFYASGRALPSSLLLIRCGAGDGGGHRAARRRLLARACFRGRRSANSFGLRQRRCLCSRVWNRRPVRLLLAALRGCAAHFWLRSTAVSICVPMGLIAWSSAGSCCITDLSLQVREGT
jgi:hypothetical protein